jgi:hypothetical protein
MRNRIRIDTVKQANELAAIAAGLNGRITITDGNGLTVNAKSVLGALHAMEFENLWVDSEEDIYMAIEPFIIIEPQS